MTLVRALNSILRANYALNCKRLKVGLTNKAFWLVNFCNTVCQTVSWPDTSCNLFSCKSQNCNN